jgi:hypothetical protein
LSHEIAGRPVLDGLLTYFTLSTKTNYITYMIINYSLHDYIRTCLLYLGIFFYILSLRKAQVCVHYLDHIVFTPVINISLLYKYVTEIISTLES